jgi:hypothetical protein
MEKSYKERQTGKLSSLYIFVMLITIQSTNDEFNRVEFQIISVNIMTNYSNE